MGSPNASLHEHLARALPDGVQLDLFHVSTPPTACPALFAPPPGQKPVKTYCEQHFLNVAHPIGPSRRVALLAIEIFIYTTDALTTVFVSKADSTGYAYLLSIPPGHRSALKTIASSFVEFLVCTRHRKDRKLNISLFARAQDQYLFPGSVEHGKKHVLSDRQLVKWWCSVLDPILRRYSHPADTFATGSPDARLTSQGYLIVPGHDKYETAAFLPASVKSDAPDFKRWVNGHPLRKLTSYPGAAPRSMVPHFPDDPKSRFLLDLEEEIANAAPVAGELDTQPSPSKRGTGQWKSVKSLEQFWEMMAFRQECSSGRLVGFLWILFSADDAAAGSSNVPPSPSLRPAKRKLVELDRVSEIGKSREGTRKKRKAPKGPIVIRAPRVKTAGDSSQPIKTVPEKTRHWFWPKHTRGSIVLTEKTYERVVKILHRLDFAKSEVACASTEKWIKETAVISGASLDWGVRVVGKAAPPNVSKTNVDAISPLPDQAHGSPSQPIAAAVRPGSTANTLNTSLIRKKAKSGAKSEDVNSLSGNDAPISSKVVNSLGMGLVRKKPKP